MIKNIIKSTFMALPAALLLAACQSEPEVGETLYPKASEDYSPVAYIDNRSYVPKNFKATTFAQKGSTSELDIPTDTLTFKVQLTAVSDKDLSFSLKIDNSKISAANAENHKALDVSAFKLENATVTVKAGEMESSESFRVALDGASKELLTLAENEPGIAAFTIESPEGVKISDKYNAYLWELKKEVRWVDVNGTINGLTQLNTSDYDVNAGSYGGISNELSDNNDSSFKRSFVSAESNQFMKIDLRSTQAISAIQLSPCGFLWGSRLNEMFAKEIEILGSSTEQPMMQVPEEDFTRLGFATCQKTPTGPSDKWNIVFYGSQTVRHIWIRFISTTNGGDQVFLSELRLFK